MDQREFQNLLFLEINLEETTLLEELPGSPPPRFKGHLRRIPSDPPVGPCQ